jgi:hypothetical protein
VWRSDTRVSLMTAENMAKLERLNKLREVRASVPSCGAALLRISARRHRAP